MMEFPRIGHRSDTLIRKHASVELRQYPGNNPIYTSSQNSEINRVGRHEGWTLVLVVRKRIIGNELVTATG